MNFVIVNNMKDYYIFKSGRFSRKDNSIFFETTDGNIPLPINDIDSIYLAFASTMAKAYRVARLNPAVDGRSCRDPTG